jgi:hypothetical protein
LYPVVNSNVLHTDAPGAAALALLFLR